MVEEGVISDSEIEIETELPEDDSSFPAEVEDKQTELTKEEAGLSRSQKRRRRRR
jgi:hypothetical protein